jgi:hypothetical protein
MHNIIEEKGPVHIEYRAFDHSKEILIYRVRKGVAS